MIYSCPRCATKNRLPDTPPQNGGYHCGHCGQALTPSLTAPLIPPGQARRQRVVLWLNGLSLLLLLVLTVSNTLGPELWWPGSLNLYLPQWPWVIPSGFLLLLTGLWARRWLWLPLLALLWGLGPIMGFSTGKLFSSGLSPSTSGRGTAAQLRVMTYNVKSGSRDAEAVAEDIQKYQPDLIQMQDAESVLNTKVAAALTGWTIRTSGQYLVASRYPLPDLESRDISFRGSNHHCVRYTLTLGSNSITVYNVHLLSPRNGLGAARHRHFEELDGNVQNRLSEAGRLAGYLRQESGPMLVTGDLNAPVQSLVCRSLFETGLRDAFSDAGLGYGYTYGAYTKIGQPYVRIDHILVSRQWQVTRCEVGNAQGSDHCPVIADLSLR